MPKLTTLDDLRQLRESLKNNMQLRENADNSDNLPQIKIGMATCGIAAGAKIIMENFFRELAIRDLQAVITQTDCMGLCYAEPTVEVILPSKEPITFGHVTESKVVEIIESYILQGIIIDGVIPINLKNLK